MRPVVPGECKRPEKGTTDDGAITEDCQLTGVTVLLCCRKAKSNNIRTCLRKARRVLGTFDSAVASVWRP